jgi:hypothetical protein
MTEILFPEFPASRRAFEKIAGRNLENYLLETAGADPEDEIDTPTASYACHAAATVF